MPFVFHIASLPRYQATFDFVYAQFVMADIGMPFRIEFAEHSHVDVDSVMGFVYIDDGSGLGWLHPCDYIRKAASPELVAKLWLRDPLTGDFVPGCAQTRFWFLNESRIESEEHQFHASQQTDDPLTWRLDADDLRGLATAKRLVQAADEKELIEYQLAQAEAGDEYEAVKARLAECDQSPPMHRSKTERNLCHLSLIGTLQTCSS